MCQALKDALRGQEEEKRIKRKRWRVREAERRKEENVGDRKDRKKNARGQERGGKRGRQVKGTMKPLVKSKG